MEKQELSKVKFVLNFLKKLVIVSIMWVLSSIPVTLIAFRTVFKASLPFSGDVSVILLSILISAFLFFILYKYDVVKFNANWINKKNAMYIVLGYVFLFLNNKVLTFLGQSGTDNGDNISKVLSNTDKLTVIIVMGILGPILEECVFRGGLMGILLNRKSIISVFISGFAFTFIHGPSDVLSFFNYFIPGLVFSFVYFKSQRLEVSITLHVINNLIALLMVYFM